MSTRTRTLVSIVAITILCTPGVRGQQVRSPDGRFRAEIVRRDGVHYQVRDAKTGDLILTTRGEFNDPNDVKAGQFSPDSTKFSAVYHYGHAGNYSWYGVWSTETGKLLYPRRKSGWTTSFSGVFEDDPPRTRP